MAAEAYYFASGKPVGLDRSPFSRVVRWDPMWDVETPAELVGREGEPLGLYEFVVYDVDELEGLGSNRSLPNEVPVYYAQGAELIPTPEFFVHFKPGVSLEAIQTLNRRYKVEVVTVLDPQSQEYILTPENGSPEEAICLANLYYESSLVESSQPNFIRIMPKHTPLHGLR